MQNTGCDFPRTSLLGTSVNKEGEAREALAQYLVQTLRSYGHRGCSGSSRKGGVVTIASFVLSTIAITSSCSGCGTSNLSIVCCKSSMNDTHSSSVIIRCR